MKVHLPLLTADLTTLAGLLVVDRSHQRYEPPPRDGFLSANIVLLQTVPIGQSGTQRKSQRGLNESP